MNGLFANLQKIDKPLPDVPLQGDWRQLNPDELPQSLDDFKKQMRERFFKPQHFICVYPLFQSTPNELAQRIIANSVEVLAAFFCVPVRIGPRPPEDRLPPRNKFKTEIGYGPRAPSVLLLDLMRTTHKPHYSGYSNGFSHILITDCDLWCDEDDPDDYVFGLSREDGAIVSTARLLQRANHAVAEMSRFVKILLHESGHTFHLGHCQAKLCLMNGKETLSEIDRHPVELCSFCLEKLTALLLFRV